MNAGQPNKYAVKYTVDVYAYVEEGSDHVDRVVIDADNVRLDGEVVNVLSDGGFAHGVSVREQAFAIVAAESVDWPSWERGFEEE